MSDAFHDSLRKYKVNRDFESLHDLYGISTRSNIGVFFYDIAEKYYEQGDLEEAQLYLNINDANFMKGYRLARINRLTPLHSRFPLKLSLSFYSFVEKVQRVRWLKSDHDCIKDYPGFNYEAFGTTHLYASQLLSVITTKDAESMRNMGEDFYMRRIVLPEENRIFEDSLPFLRYTTEIGCDYLTDYDYDHFIEIPKPRPESE